MLCTKLFFLFAASCLAQARFEVAAIKPHPVDGQFGRLGSPFRIAGSRVTLGVVSLNELIAAAYEVRDFQISGAPAWATEGSHRYDIEAKVAGDSTPTPDQVRQMLQTLLVERFHLSLHRDSKEFKVYHLTLGKDGARVKLAETGSARPAAPAQRLPIETLDNLIARFLDRPLVDKTGLSGTVDFTMDFASLDSGQISIITAVQESLGLKIESATDPMPVLIIERAEQPSEN
jgi:uncharacterized protein (TIGR03435 family)